MRHLLHEKGQATRRRVVIAVRLEAAEAGRLRREAFPPSEMEEFIVIVRGVEWDESEGGWSNEGAHGGVMLCVLLLLCPCFRIGGIDARAFNILMYVHQTLHATSQRSRVRLVGLKCMDLTTSFSCSLATRAKLSDSQSVRSLVLYLLCGKVTDRRHLLLDNPGEW